MAVAAHPIAVNHQTGVLTYPETTGNTQPSNYGFLAWTQDPFSMTTATASNTSGTLYATRLTLPYTASVTSVCIHVITGGVTLTAGQSFACLYAGDGALIGQTADQSTDWANAGFKKMALTGGPFTCSAGDYYVAWWSVGGTAIIPIRGASGTAGPANNNTAAPNLRSVSTSNTGLTTTAPGTMGTQSSASAWWGALA